LLDQLSTFQFAVYGHESISLHSRTKQHHDPIARMIQWDRDIRERCRPSLVDDISSFHYNLVDDASGIAISKKDFGFARVDLSIQRRDDSSESPSNLLLSGILTVQFASTSSRLCSVSWTISQYHPSFSVYSIKQDRVVVTSSSPSNSLTPSSLSSSSKETLENQMIHPSVVSLDLKASHTETTEANDPGMSI
jgi:hypothetical protein